MSSPTPLPLKYQPLDPQKLTYAILSATTHARQALRHWGLRGAWNLWRGTVASLLRNRFRGGRKDSAPQTALVTLLVISIYPDLIKTWYHFATKFVDMQRTQLLIVDSCGRIDPKLFPAARVVRFCNFSHARKIDYFIRHEINTPYVWLCDDDSMIIQQDTLSMAFAQLDDDKMAAVSLQPRGWSFDVNGQTHRAMGVYNILFSREIFIKEDLSFSPIRSKNMQVGRGTGYYDTGDYANEQLLLRGYQVKTIDTEDLYVKSFVGVSSAMLKVLNVLDAYSDLEDEVKANPKVASYHLVGLYCDWKIVGLYRQIFLSEPQWLPPLSEPQIRQLLRTLPAELVEKAAELLDTHDAKYQSLSQLAAHF